MGASSIRTISYEPAKEDVVPLTQNQLLEIYYYLLLTRTLENKVEYICKSQNLAAPLIIGKGYLSTGQEAISVGAAYALEEGDWLAPSHRDMGAHLVRGFTPKEIFLQYFCRASSVTWGRDSNVHFGDVSKRILGFASHMGSLTPVANGVAMAMRYRGEKNVVLSPFGDGASSQGIVHEALNYAAVNKLAVVFVLNNNHYAISTPIEQQTMVESLSLRAAGYGMVGKTIDGNSVLEVYKTVKEAVDRARRGEGPSLIECKTMRMGGHGTHDAMTYIPKNLLENWKRRDPIVGYERYLVEEKGISHDQTESVARRIEGEIEEALEFARSQPLPKAEDLLRER
ncbi:MAG: thiamine pyrophosphate-dependent dehydrogenase E1 component subunit alpha [Deltaproteobacteria bacterium]|nr:thiamine pyrophosphate-dependent dehydrogenase E1 component subunit alpha [Deltaproteobacteria bacterium]MBI2500351.1 thiamine pyrophosphate-dependent dehydrogenase E1 component subunit alpha [Deltaproteobacteria bacterium]